MIVEYTLTMEQSVGLHKEFLRQLPSVRGSRRKWKFIALGGGTLYAFLHQTSGTFNGSPSPAWVNVVLAIFVQIPLVSWLILFVVNYALNVPVRFMEQTIRDQPGGDWGRRTLEIMDGNVSVKRQNSSHTIKIEIINGVIETHSGYHFLSGQDPVLSLPRGIPSIEEIKMLLLNKKTLEGTTQANP